MFQARALEISLWKKPDPTVLPVGCRGSFDGFLSGKLAAPSEVIPVIQVAIERYQVAGIPKFSCATYSVNLSIPVSWTE
jgi:hypothetical protein